MINPILPIEQQLSLANIGYDPLKAACAEKNDLALIVSREILKPAGQILVATYGGAVSIYQSSFLGRTTTKPLFPAYRLLECFIQAKGCVLSSWIIQKAVISLWMLD